MEIFTITKKVITVALVALVLFNIHIANAQQLQEKIDVVTLNETDNTVVVDFMQLEDGMFNRVWLYHELHDDKSIVCRAIDGKGIVEISAADSKTSLQGIYIKATGYLEKTLQLDAQYDKEVKGSLMASCQDIYGDQIMDFLMGIKAPTDIENDSCHKSMPFCTGTIYSFPAGVNTGSAQSGPNYGCLSTRPNPVWYHMKIENPGNITIRMIGKRLDNSPLDIDFALWGPYANPITPCVAQLTANCSGNGCPNNTQNPNFYPSGNLHDCSFDGSSVEHAHIVDGLTGQYYILLITNYANAPGNITFSQTAGDGSTDCTILPPAASSNSPVCIGNTIELNAANAPGATYLWSGPNGYTSNQQNPTIANAQTSYSGIYSVTITVQGIQSDPALTNVSVIAPPTGTLSALTPTSICQGDSIHLQIVATSMGPYRAVLNSGSGIPSILNFWQPVYTFWVYPTDTTTYTLSGISNSGCSGTTSGSVTATVRPKPTPLFNSSNPCANLTTQFTDMSTVTGGSISSWLWNYGDMTTTSNLQNPTHVYTNANTYNVTLTITANNGCSKSVTSPVQINPTPSIFAGSDISIPYGTFTSLNGSVLGGSGTHTYLWTPSDKVNNATILNPNTVPLGASVDFLLTATDANGCQKSDDLTVTITGGPLSGLVNASPSEICVGESTVLNAVPSGGTGIYTYTWTSNPSGFNSVLEDPTVSPTVTTTYYLSVYDNFNTIEAQTTVTVNQKPIVDAGIDKTIQHGTSTNLASTVTGGAPQYQYSWTPANVLLSPNAQTTLTNNLYGSTSFNLLVTDSKGCKQNDEMTVNIAGGPLQVNPIAMQPVICRNESTVLRALPSGGSNEYTSYTWISVPAGFNSSSPEPTVTPIVSTTYQVSVFDGYNTTTGYVTVNVNQLPVIDLIPDDPKVTVISNTEIGLCVFDTIPISAGNPGATYLWSNGSIEQSILLATSGISFDMQQYNVVVTIPETGCSNTANITASFTFSNCSYGIEEIKADNRLKVYPNPSGDGIFNMLIEDLQGATKLEVYNAQGMIVYATDYMLPGIKAFREELNLGNTHKGIYFLKLSNNEAVIIQKIIIR